MTPGVSRLAIGRRLRDEWSTLVGVGAAEVVAGEDLLERWAEPHRRYHNLRHLAQTLDHLTELGGHSRAVRLAAWYHDAAYDPDRPDQEAASAELATSTLDRLGLGRALVAEVARLVRLTATHEPAVGDTDGSLLCDADLAVLGSSPAGYAEYRSAVRAEYAALPDAAWADGRARVLSALLARPAIFTTAAGWQRWETRARANLAAELAELVELAGQAAHAEPAEESRGSLRPAAPSSGPREAGADRPSAGGIRGSGC